MERSLSQETDLLSPFTSCDVADALQILGFPSVLLDISLVSPFPGGIVGQGTRICGPAHTVLYVSDQEAAPVKDLPTEHPADTVPKGGILVLATPPGSPNAVWGGLAASRSVVRGALGIITDGRTRDLQECTELGFPVFCKGLSTVGAKGYVRLAAIGTPIQLNASTPWPVPVSQGDIILGDIHGVVCIPSSHVAQVAQICAKRSKEDALVKSDVLERGVPLQDAMRSHRK